MAMVKKAYEMAALLALLNGAALVGVVGFLFGTGRIDREKAYRLVAVLRGEDGGEAPDESVGDPGATAPADIGTEDVSTETQINEEIRRRESDRIKAELQQMLALNNRILLQLKMEKEAFEQEKMDTAKREEVRKKNYASEGFQTQVKIYGKLAPRIALDHLLGMGDPAEAAKVLAAIPVRNAKKIVEAAKKGDQLKKMLEIMRQVGEVAPERLAALEKGNDGL